MTTYHKDIDCNGSEIYYKANRHRFVRASKEQAKLEISTGAADVVDYVPNKPVGEMTDRQLLAKIEQGREFGYVPDFATDEAEDRGIL